MAIIPHLPSLASLKGTWVTGSLEVFEQLLNNAVITTAHHKNNDFFI